MAEERRLFKITRFLLLVSGMWPLDLPGMSRFQQFLYNVYYVVNHMIYATAPIAFAGTFITNLDVNFFVVMESFSRMTFVGLVVFKLAVIRSKEMVDIMNLVTAEELKITQSKDQKILKMYRFHVNYCVVMAFFIVAFLYAAGVLNMLNGCTEIHEWNLQVNKTGLKPHIVKFWLPFDSNRFYWISIAYETCHIFQTLAINGSIVMVVNGVMVFLRANMKILQYEIRNFDRGTDGVCSQAESEANLKQAIIKHHLIIDWVNDLNGSFKNILLLEYSVLSLLLATTLIQIIQRVRIFFNLVFFLHSLLQFFGLAWNANEIVLESSEGLLGALYECNWYQWNTKIRMTIYMMMIRCRRPLEINIGPLGTLDINAAVSRVKVAYTCLSVL